MQVLGVGKDNPYKPTGVLNEGLALLSPSEKRFLQADTPLLRGDYIGPWYLLTTAHIMFRLRFRELHDDTPVDLAGLHAIEDSVDVFQLCRLVCHLDLALRSKIQALR